MNQTITSLVDAMLDAIEPIVEAAIRSFSVTIRAIGTTVFALTSGGVAYRFFGEPAATITAVVMLIAMAVVFWLTWPRY